VIARNNDQIVRDDRVAMELGGAAILSRVERPDGSAGLFIERAEKAVARTNKN